MDLTQFHQWMTTFVDIIKKNFDNNICAVGIQGSYGRQEAIESSDLDVVVVFRQLDFAILQQYRQVTSDLPHRDKLCGFLCGRNELAFWDPSDLFQFVQDTTILWGSLEDILPPIEEKDIQKAILTGACNIYHGACHNMIHEKNPDILKELIKACRFVLQAKYYLKTGQYMKKKADLLPICSQEEQMILTAASLSDEEELDRISWLVMQWASQTIQQFGKNL